MSLACLDSPAPGTLKRHIIEKKEISLTKTTLYGSRAHVKTAHSAISLANILPIDYFQIYAYVHCKGLRWDFLRRKKVTDKVGAPKSIDADAAALCPSISELRHT